MEDCVTFQRVLDALLREDHLGLQRQGSFDHGWWAAALHGKDIRFLVEPDGYQHEWRTMAPFVLVDGSIVSTLDGLLETLAPVADPEAEAGWAAFTVECHDHVRSQRLLRPAPLRRLPGMAGALEYEVQAAHADHPVHPASKARHGLTEKELLAYAPEHAPVFALQWIHCPDAFIAGTLPDWWPSQELLPAHPLTVERLGLPTVTGPEIWVQPTLSMRTVSLLDDPYTHLKLPLATATLGARNKRLIAPGTLVDGAVMQQFLSALAFDDRIMFADETTYGHDGDSSRAFLLRRYPVELASAEVVPVAALPAFRDAREVIEAYLDLLIDWHVYLWLRQGVALEAHQQNIHLVLGPGSQVRLLYKDNDGARVHPRHNLPLDDNRMFVTDASELADVFTTITLHLAAAAPLLALGMDPSLLYPKLVAAHEKWGPSEMFRQRILEAETLPIKAMLTAGTLLPKQRLGCTDINKHYLRTGPNYLKASR